MDNCVYFVRKRIAPIAVDVSSFLLLSLTQLAVRDCASDSSPYVRKCAANAIPKIFVLDPDQAPQLWQVRNKSCRAAHAVA